MIKLLLCRQRTEDSEVYVKRWGGKRGGKSYKNQRCTKMPAKPIFDSRVPKHALEYKPSLGAPTERTHTNVQLVDAVA